jgi:murein DD-endopeptidase MepM/ murein hydrolase activator NlpD
MSVLFAGRDTSTMDCSSFAPRNDPPYAGFGNYLKTQDAAGFVYWWGHVNRWRVNAGDQVTAGQIIADMGKTGCSTGSHLHFRVRLNGVDRNPLEVIRK